MIEATFIKNNNDLYSIFSNNNKGGPDSSYLGGPIKDKMNANYAF